MTRIRSAALAASVAVACSAQSASARTWYFVNLLERKCEVSRLTPEQFATAPIPARNATKFSNGEIIVEVDRMVEGEKRVTYFFTSMEGCEIVARGLKNALAPRDDIN